MRQNATRSLVLALTLAVVGVLAPATSVNAQELGDDFIFFVNGTNVQVPNFNGTVVNDPFDATNSVLRMDYADFSEQMFNFSKTVGIDMSANQAAGDTLSFSFLVDPVNAGKGTVSVGFMDKTDDSGANDGTADNAFRLRWNIPEGMRDGAWHTVQLPLPAATWADLQAAKAAGIDGLDSLWSYDGSWSTGGFGISLDGTGPNGENGNLFREFEWTNVWKMGVHFDNNAGGGPVYLDNVYLGAGSLDISSASEPGPAMSGVSFAADGAANVVSWTPSSDWGGYNIHVSQSPITDIDADGVYLLGAKVSADSEIRHQFEVPHPSLLPLEFYYAVTSLSNFGVENKDVSASAGSVSNPDLKISPRITQLTSAEGDALFDALGAGTAVPEGLAAFEPFVMDAAHSQQGEQLGFPTDDADNSATVWLGYTDLNELYVYAEVRDDSLEYSGADVPASDAWQYDSIEFGWGNYDISDVGGSLLDGSPNIDMGRGDFADYQFRVSGHVQTDGSIVGQMNSNGSGNNPAGSGSVFEDLMDGGVRVGYKFLAVIPLDAIQNLTEGDAVYPVPGSSEIRLMPFNIASNDADGATRETQIVWSLRGNVTNNWWNTPNQWPVVAMIGRDLATSIDGTDDVPTEFAVYQNYPNPFNQTTTIRFALDSASDVTLRVYDILGRVVATPIAAQKMSEGEHVVTFDARTLASGQYLYRLEAGSASQSRRMLLVK